MMKIKLLTSRRPVGFFSGLPERVCLILVLCGIALRLAHYLADPSLWVDEAWVAVNIISRSWHEMFMPVPFLDDWTNRPLGFSLIVKLLTLFSHNSNEYVLRALPVLSGVGSVVLFDRILKRQADPLTRVAAVAFFSLSPALIHYAAELKQYSSDIFIALALLWCFLHARRREFSFGSTVLLAIAGWGGLWMSQTAVFVLAGMGGVFFVGEICRRRWRSALYLLCLAGIWFSALGLLYILIYQFAGGNPRLLHAWSSDFPPAGLTAQFSWGVGRLQDIVGSVLISPEPVLILILFFLGLIRMARRSVWDALIMAVPMGLAVCAAFLHKYPMAPRLWLCFTPFIVWFIAEGCSALVRVRRCPPWLGPAVVALLLVVPLKADGHAVRTSFRQEDNRSVLAFMNRLYKPGDLIISNASAQMPLWYYLPRMPVFNRIPKWELTGGKTGIVLGKFNNEVLGPPGRPYVRYVEQVNVFDQKRSFRTLIAQTDLVRIGPGENFDFLKAPRVWVFLSHARPGLEPFIVRKFSDKKLLASFKGKGVSLRLYRLH